MNNTNELITKTFEKSTSRLGVFTQLVLTEAKGSLMLKIMK